MSPNKMSGDYLSRGCRWLLILCLVFSSIAISTAQAELDTIDKRPEVMKEKKGSIFSGRPGKALVMSLIVPGAGQIYNKSYLRVPFVWGAVGGMGYLMIRNTQQYKCYREAYIARVDNDPLTLPSFCYPQIPGTTNITPEFLATLDPAIIRRERDNANVYKQWSIVGFSLVWLLNGVDAFVDAHLKEFDIDEDLSIDIGPKLEDDPFAPMRMGVFVKF